MTTLSAPDDLDALSAEEVLEHAVERFHPGLYVACSFQKEASVIMHMLLEIEPTVARQAALYGDALWKRNPEACCGLRKVSPLEEALSGVDAWVSGLRRDQSPGRADAPKLAWDARRGVHKVNPLADWSDREVWSYIFRHDLPYHELHDRGYASIGCTHCTKPGNGREGRWAESERTECGIH